MLFAATQEVFTSMLGSEVQRLSEPETEQSASFDGVLVLIGLVGAVIGNGALVCDVEAACDLSSRLLMSGLVQNHGCHGSQNANVGPSKAQPGAASARFRTSAAAPRHSYRLSAHVIVQLDPSQRVPNANPCSKTGIKSN